MNLKETVYLITALITFESAIYVLRLNLRSATNIIYFFFTANVAIFTFILFMMSGADNCETCQWWYNLSIVSACLGPPLTLHFSLSITRKRIALSPPVIALLYVPAVIFMVVISRYDYFLSFFYMTGWGWETVVTVNSSHAIIFMIYGNLITLAGLLIIFIWRYRAVNEIDRIHSGSVLFPYIVGQAGLLLSPYFIHIENNEPLNLLCDLAGSFLFIVFIVGIRYSIAKYSFMKISSASPARDIINGLNAPVLLVEGSGKIIHYNKKAGELIAGKCDETGHFADIFESPVIVKIMLERTASGLEPRSSIKCGISLNKKDSGSFCISMKSISSADRGDTAGVLVFMKEDNSVNHFREKYSITGRQIDILLMVLSGMTNREIALKTGLAEKTVENHIFNIYNKLGIDNKMELYNLSQKYGLLPD